MQAHCEILLQDGRLSARHQPQVSDRTAVDLGAVHSHLPIFPRGPQLEGVVVMRGQTLTRLTDGFEEATVVDRREIDDLAISGERVLLERPYCEDGADVDRAPVTAMGHLAAQPAPEDRLPVEDRVREDR